MISEELPLKANLLLNCRSSSRFHFLLLLALGWAAPCLGKTGNLPLESGGSTYELLEKKANAIASENHTNGWAYIISGGVTFGISIPAYYISEDVFAKAIYMVGETLGIASIGYGSYLVLIENDYSRFHRVIHGVPGLSHSEKNDLSERFLEENAKSARNVRKIRVITHSLVAGLNFLDGFTTSNQDLKISHFFLAGINTIAALSFGLSKSEEENFTQSLVGKKRTSTSFFFGPIVGVRVNF